MMLFGLRDASTLGPSQVDPNAIDLSTPTAPMDFVQRVEVQSVTLWRLLLAGVVTGFAMAIGDTVFRYGLKRFEKR